MVKKKEPIEEKPVEIPLPNPEEATIICGVIRHLGGDYLLVKCLDGYDRKARIPGKLRKKSGSWRRLRSHRIMGPWIR